MRDFFTTLIITITKIMLVVVFAVFGLIFWEEVGKGLLEEFKGVETVAKTENENKSFTIGEEDTIDKDIKTPEIITTESTGLEDGNTRRNIDDTVNYENITIDKYFYNQLEEESKTIYKALEENKENMKTGTYKINLGSSFSDLITQTGNSELLSKYYQSAIEAFNYDNSDMFYVTPNKMYLNIETITRGNNVTYNFYINSGNESNYFADGFSTEQEVRNAIKLVEQKRDEILRNKTEDTYSNIKMVHDYLIDNVKYDTTISKSHIYNIYGTMIQKEAVCEGYARSFKYLMDALNIPCTIVIGKGTNSEGNTENHAWNYVQINNTWYAIDCTWDDPVSESGWVPNSSKYKYFLKGLNEMSKDHVPSGQFTEGGKVFKYPDISSSNY